jgi:phosphoenolpyruvate carboxylase
VVAAARRGGGTRIRLDLGANPGLSALLLREYDLTKTWVFTVTGHTRLLEDRRVLSWAIELRNP